MDADHSDGECLIKDNDVINSADVSFEEKRRHRSRSHKHFRHHEENLTIDFVLAAKNLRLKSDNNRKTKEIERIRKNFFHNLKKKRLKISPRPIKSKVSFFDLMTSTRGSGCKKESPGLDPRPS